MDDSCQMPQVSSMGTNLCAKGEQVFVPVSAVASGTPTSLSK